MSNYPKDDGFLSQDTEALFLAIKNQQTSESEAKTAPTSAAPIHENTEEKTAAQTKEEPVTKEEIQNRISEPDKHNTNEKPKRKSKLLGFFGVLLVVVSIAVGVLVYLYTQKAETYKTIFFPNTSINGYDVSGLTVEQTKDLIKKKTEVFKLVIEEKDGKQEEINAKDIELSYVDTGEVDQILADQNTGDWYRESKKEHTFTVSTDTDYSREALTKTINSLACLQEENQVPPENAVMQKDKDGKYVIIPEDDGNMLDREKTEELIKNAVDERKDSISLEENDCYLHAKIKSNNKKLKKTVKKLNKFLNMEINYIFGDNKETILGKDLEQYITNKDGKVKINTDWVAGLVSEWAKKYDSFGLSRKFTTHSGETITVVAGGDYGWCMDQEQTTADLVTRIKKAKSGDYEASWRYRAMGWDNNDLTGTFAEVSISEQKLWLHKDGEIILETDIVTGRATPDRETIPGCYAIDAKKSPAVLGTLDVQGYSNPVDYWMPFNGGQGLHDAPWRSSFGGDIYIEGGSHGCVNCPPSVMKTIYDSLEIGNAVVIY